MEGKGGCCVTRYARDGGSDISKVNRIMLRFRPIAPKPVAGNNPSGGSVSCNSSSHTRVGRTKRKYAKEGSNISNNGISTAKSDKRCSRRPKAASEARADPVVTLPLMPETPDRKENGSPWDLAVRRGRNTSRWLSFENWSAVEQDPSPPENECCLHMEQAGVARPEPVRSVGSCVTVEYVTDSWLDGNSLGCTDEEKWANLSEDACPGFITDVLGRVTWTNRSFTQMVSQNDDSTASGGWEAMKVWLVMEERAVVSLMAATPYRAFTCRVRVQCCRGKDRSSWTLPCDVWRMDAGGFAWKLDVKAALSLSLGP